MVKVNLHRDQAWLEDLLSRTWRDYFSDVERVNNLRIEFGRRAKRRLGSISVDPKQSSQSVIRINGWFRQSEIPEFLVQSVIVHELCHYAHGFNSGAEETQHRYPHAGGVIRQEFAGRGLVALYDEQQQWLKEHWGAFIRSNHPQAKPKRRPAKRQVAQLPALYQKWFR
ncbi:MAG: hypothetical protein WD467_01315 [Candidatus Saccharimonadales bacterium]